jgi:Clp amino terminal domain, pathogenicity island component
MNSGRFSNDVRTSLALSQELARKSGASCVGVGHLFQALLGISAVRDLLRVAHADLVSLLAEAERHDAAIPPGKIGFGELAYEPAVRDVIHAAADPADSQRTVDSLDLLIHAVRALGQLELATTLAPLADQERAGL